MWGLCHSCRNIRVVAGWQKCMGCVIAGKNAGAMAGYQKYNGNGGLEAMYRLCQAGRNTGVVAGWQKCSDCAILAEL